MFTVTQTVEEVLLRHFIQTKQDIADAINDPFPFFEALRDHRFITEKMYKDSLDACQDLVPLSRVVLSVLTSLERTFHPSLLQTLFSQINLREYPSLGAIFRSFENAAKNDSPAPNALEMAQEVPSAPAKQKKDSPAPNNLEMAQEAPSVPAKQEAKKKERRHLVNTQKKTSFEKGPTQGVASPGQGVQKKLKVVDQRTQRKNDSTRNLKVVTRSQKARTGHAQISRAHVCRGGDRSPITCKEIAGMSKDDTSDFLSPTLPVTCGKAKGILFKHKMKQGASGKCIQNEAGDWLTPKEFLMEGQRSKSKDWKRDIRCKQKTLRFLEQNRFL